MDMDRPSEETIVNSLKKITKEEILENAHMMLMPKGERNVDEIFRDPEIAGKLVTRDVSPDIMGAYTLKMETDAPSEHTYVAKDMLKDIGMTVEELHDAAMENIRRSYIAMPIEQTIRMLSDEGTEQQMGAADKTEEQRSSDADKDSPVPMIVLTSKDHHFGAAAILLPEAQKDVSEMFGGSFLVCPSSRHEVICIPDEMEKLDYFERMVHDINSFAVSDKEFLSNTVLRYDSGSKVLEPARDYADRQVAAEISESLNKGETIQAETTAKESPYPGLPPCPEPRRIEQKRGMDIC